jgi:hypothetical protein
MSALVGLEPASLPRHAVLADVRVGVRSVELDRLQHSRSQRENTPGGGASGKGVRNRIEAGGADCASVSSGLAVSGESEIDGFFGGSTTVRGGCGLRAAALIFFFGASAATFGIFFGAITGAASGALPGNTSPSPVKFTLSNHREIVIFRSSIAAHPARPKLADTVIEMSATRAQAPIDTLAIRDVAGSLSGHWDGPSVTPYSCGAVNGHTRSRGKPS